MINISKKGSCTAVVVTLALTLLAPNTLVYASQMIYGLSQASHVSSARKGPFYIQVGSFKSASKAQLYLQRVHPFIHHPVSIKQHGIYHAVIIGPISSVNDIRRLHLPSSASPTLKIKNPTLQLTSSVRKKSHSASNVAPTVSTSKPIPDKDLIGIKPISLSSTSTHSMYLQADLGVTAPRATSNSLIYNGAIDPFPANMDVYSANTHKHGEMFSLIGGSRWHTNTHWIPAYAIALRYQHYFNQHAGGTIMQYSDPLFVNYNYDWQFQSNVFSLFSKINIFEFKQFLPYVDLGVGYALNHTKNYNETPIGDVVARIDSPAYGSHNNNHVSYNIGAGIDYQLTRALLVSLGYEFQNIGLIRTGCGKGQWAGGHLEHSGFKTNAGLFSLSYLFGA